MTRHTHDVFRRLRVATLLALLIAAPALHAVDRDSGPSLFTVFQAWIISLFDDDGSGTSPDPGTIQIPGG